MEERPDITVNEIREKLQLTASYSTVERAIQAMGYTLKKKSLYASEVVIDNLRSHHVKEVGELLEAEGVIPLYLPL